MTTDPTASPTACVSIHKQMLSLMNISDNGDVSSSMETVVAVPHRTPRPVHGRTPPASPCTPPISAVPYGEDNDSSSAPPCEQRSRAPSPTAVGREVSPDSNEYPPLVRQNATVFARPSRPSADDYMGVHITQQPPATDDGRQKRTVALRRRDFCVTFWGDVVPVHNFDFYRDRLRYVVWQRERCPTTNKLHWQMYFECISPEYVTFIKNTILEDDQTHVEIRRKSRQQARIYCMKRETRTFDLPSHGPFEWGDFNQQGTRTDLEQLHNDIADGQTIKEISANHFNTALRYNNGIKLHRSIHLQEIAQKPRKLTVKVFIGETGSGKTYTAMQEANAICVAGGLGDAPYILDYDGDEKQGSVWFDGYDGQTCLIIDDYNGWLSVTHLLRILDEYPLRLPTKGSHTWACYTNVWITSNKRPGEWLSRGNPIDPRHKKALWRRLTHVVEFPDRVRRVVIKAPEPAIPDGQHGAGGPPGGSAVVVNE